MSKSPANARRRPATPKRRAPSVLPPLDPTAFALDSYMADAKTRVFNLNGRKLVSILGREDFPGERLFKLPTKVIEFANRQPLTAALLPCRIGFSPRANGQKVIRASGDWALTLLFCLDGMGAVELSQGKHRMTRGTFALLRPFEFHAYEADARQPWSYYWIHFHGTMAQQYYDLLTNGGKNTYHTVDSDQRFVEAFEKILNIYRDGQAYKILVQASAAMHQLLGDLYGLVCNPGGPQESPRARIERTMMMMGKNLSMRVSIHELAVIANMSHAYYTQQFKKHTGESPRRYFNKMKIAKACEYLEQTGNKVENIAHLVGYDDSFYFCRLFKRVTGKTPTLYRQSRLESATRREANDSRHE